MPLHSVPSSISPQRVKPRALRPGDTVGIVAPASNIQRTLLEAGCRALSELGYNPFYLPSILEQDLSFPGSVGRRVRVLEQTVDRAEVRPIISAPGRHAANSLPPPPKPRLPPPHPTLFFGH